MSILGSGMTSGGFQRPRPGADICGDGTVLIENANELLAFVIDGLGAGESASRAARMAEVTIRENAVLPLDQILMKCHQVLATESGAAIGGVRIDGNGHGVFTGIGNVQLQSSHADVAHVVPRSGIIGHSVDYFELTRFDVIPGATYCLHTDGIAGQIAFQNATPLDALAFAQLVVLKWGTPHDDAAVIVFGRPAAVHTLAYGMTGAFSTVV